MGKLVRLPKRGKSSVPKEPAAEWCDLHKLKGWQNNPKSHKTVNKIKASLKEFGWGRSIVARRQDFEIIAGHGTVQAALELYDEGFTNEFVKDFSVGPVRFRDLDTRRAHALGIADNRSAEESKWDKEKLHTAMLDFKATPSIFEATGFKYKDIFGPEKPTTEVEKEEHLAEPTEPVAKEGDVWELGDHLLVCGDAFRTKTRSRILKAPIDCVLTDPPYAIYGSSSGTGPDIADDKMVRPFFEQMWRVIKASVRDFAHVYVCCDWRSYPALFDTAAIAEIVPKNKIVWDKMNSGLGSMYSNAYEEIFFAAKLPPRTGLASTTKRGERVVHSSNIVRYPRVQGAERQDNAAKPIEMFKVFIENSTDEGETVLDLFGGSGTTLIACELTKRRCRMVEQNTKKIDIIVSRWEKRTGRKAKRIPA